MKITQKYPRIRENLRNERMKMYYLNMHQQVPNQSLFAYNVYSITTLLSPKHVLGIEICTKYTLSRR